MHSTDDPAQLIRELERLLEVSERKSDILTNLLMEATAEFEQALERVSVSEANFRAIFENAPEAIYIIDIETHGLLDCNPFLARWLGYSREELLSMRVEDILEPGAKGVGENIRKAVDDGLVYILERIFRKKSGRLAEAEVTGTLVKYEGKECFVALVRDITERKQLEALGRYKELFENVSDPVFINDADGNFLEVNDVACGRLGYPRKSLLEMNIRDFRIPGRESVFGEGNGRRFGNGKTLQMDLMTRQGEDVPFEIHARPVSFRGSPAVLSVARDLTIRKKMEEVLIKSERLKALGEMAGGVAHNFNNLLQMIMGAGEAALDKLRSGQIRDSSEAIQNIVNASRRGTDMVRRIRDFTVSGIENRPEEYRIFDIGELMAEAVEITKPLWKNMADGVKYRLNYFRGPGCFVRSNPSELYEVLVNLIKNGLEAMPAGGRLTLFSWLEGGMVHLSVKDQGEGIPKENLQRIFEPFFTTKGLRSSGLGLASSYGIVKKYDGDIVVESEPGKGTNFTLLLPLAQKMGAAGEPKPETGRSSRNSHIRFLLIDDETNILRAMEMYFEETQIEVISANSGQKGMEVVEKGDIDLILCDLGMDDMNGLEMGKRVLSFCREKNLPKIPFLLYTGMIRQLDLNRLAECGVDRVVSKPISYEELREIIFGTVSPASCTTSRPPSDP